MSQSLYTAMSGISAATTQMSVISNNVANINTTAFKSSSVEFSDVYSTTLSSGSVATNDAGGTNPIQVGVGTQIASISQNFNTGSWVSTGKDTDLMIQGSGFFTVQASDGSVYYTRAGDFSFDADGNLVTSDGYKVLGTDSILSASSSGATVQVPKTIISDIQGNANIASMKVSDLNDMQNNCKNITTGTFTITSTDTSTSPSTTATHTVTLTQTQLSGTVSDLTAAIQSQLGASGITVSSSNGRLVVTSPNSTTTLSFKSGTSNFLTATGLDNSDVTVSGQTYSSAIVDYTVSVSTLTNASESTTLNTETINEDGSIQATYKNGDTLSVQLGADGTNYEFVYTTAKGIIISGNSCSVSKDVAEPANFVIQMATVTNTGGLMSVGSNLYEAGPNTGDIVYTVGGKMGCGKLSSGGLEASNVDLSDELSNMILAQRAIEANSRVFTTTSDIMSTITQMGR